MKDYIQSTKNTTKVSLTPRTDAEVFQIHDINGVLRNVITTQFAKQLEQELQATEAALDQMTSDLVKVYSQEHFHHESYCRKCGERV
jgi:hypothetical protein